MSKTFKIKKGFDLGLAGKPALEVTDAVEAASVAVYPLEYRGFKQRLKVSEGDNVKRGSELIENKKNEKFKICAPAAGRIKSIVRGERRFVEKIVIQLDSEDAAESFSKYSAADIASLDRAAIIDQLLATGYLAFIRQRPFGCIADPDVTPKSIFVNAVNTGPFQADAGVAVSDDPEAFQAGLDILNRLTDGPVNLCTGPDAVKALAEAGNAEMYTFEGKHPAGNSSVHISRIDPMSPTDHVWTVKAVDLVQVGRLFLDGELPKNRIISIGGPAAKPEACRHYRVRAGGALGPLLAGIEQDGDNRMIAGDVLTGQIMEKDPYLRLQQSEVTVIEEGRGRYFLGWMEPGFKRHSFSRLCASFFIGGRSWKWKLNTNMNGGERAMVLSGYYDRVMPMNIMVDYLIRAVLAQDTDEAISLGILETLPEDFALCEFIDPCKLEVQEIIEQGLQMIEEEGI